MPGRLPLSCLLQIAADALRLKAVVGGVAAAAVVAAVIFGVMWLRAEGMRQVTTKETVMVALNLPPYTPGKGDRLCQEETETSPTFPRRTLVFRIHCLS